MDENLQIEYIPLDQIKAYEGNAKIHTKRQIESIAESIKQFGMNTPIAVDESGTLIYGHGRFEALKQLGYEKAPCIRLEHMTEQQRKAYILADNKLNAQTGFDLNVLSAELESITDFDMGDFGFNLDFDIPEHKETYNTRTYKFENFDKEDFPGEGLYDIPIVQGTQEVPDVTEWIDFDHVMREKQPMGKGVHFFIHDYKFQRIWQRPERYLKPLGRFECLISPDFSLYQDMPVALQIYNHYRKMWMAAYWQAHGLMVIPNVTFGGDQTLDWFLDGMPRKSTIACSSVSLADGGAWADFLIRACERIKERLEPTTVLWYGHMPENLPLDNVVRIGSPTDKRRAEIEE